MHLGFKAEESTLLALVASMAAVFVIIACVDHSWGDVVEARKAQQAGLEVPSTKA